TLSGHTGPAFAAAWSADGARLATGSWDRSARIWNGATGQVERVLSTNGRVGAVAWSTDGARLLTASDDGDTRVWDVASGASLAELAVQAGARGEEPPAAWAPDGHQVGSGLAPALGDPATGTVAHRLEGRVAPLEKADWSRDGTLVLATGPSGAATWDLVHGRRLQAYVLSGTSTTDAALSPDHAEVVTTGENGQVRLWDVA